MKPMLMWRFEVQLIDHQAFANYMTHRSESVRSLATKVDDEMRKLAAKDPKIKASKSRSLIGHLRSGQRRTAPPAMAPVIERCLGAPVGSLFVPRVSRVSTDVEAAA